MRWPSVLTKLGVSAIAAIKRALAREEDIFAWFVAASNSRIWAAVVGAAAILRIEGSRSISLVVAGVIIVQEVRVVVVVAAASTVSVVRLVHVVRLLLCLVLWVRSVSIKTKSGKANWLRIFFFCMLVYVCSYWVAFH